MSDCDTKNGGAGDARVCFMCEQGSFVEKHDDGMYYHGKQRCTARGWRDNKPDAGAGDGDNAKVRVSE